MKSLGRARLFIIVERAYGRIKRDHSKEMAKITAGSEALALELSDAVEMIIYRSMVGPAGFARVLRSKSGINSW